MALKEWQTTFLRALSEGSTITAAAREAGITRMTAFNHRKADKEFAEAWEQAFEAGTDVLEEVANRRARQHSDMLLLALLKARRPDVYKERIYNEHVRLDFHEAKEELEQMALKYLKEGEKDEEKVEIKKLPSP